MSKYFNALAVAVLGIALLMGAASAASDPVDLEGCYIPADYIALDDALLTLSVDLGDLPTAAAVAGGSMAVTAGSAWSVVCGETTSGDGKMSLDTSILANPLEVLTVALLDADTVEVANGAATLCDDGVITPATVSPTYEQDIDAVNDLGKAAGTYSIEIEYTLEIP